MITLEQFNTAIDTLNSLAIGYPTPLTDVDIMMYPNMLPLILRQYLEDNNYYIPEVEDYINTIRQYREENI